MKIALLLPGYLDSPHYLHMQTFEKRFRDLGYTVEVLDPCHLWETRNIKNYSVINYLKQIEERVSFYASKKPEEIILIGHSMGGFMASQKSFPYVLLLTEKIVANAHEPCVVRQEHMGHEFRRSQKECDIVMSKIETFLLK